MYKNFGLICSLIRIFAVDCEDTPARGEKYSNKFDIFSLA